MTKRTMIYELKDIRIKLKLNFHMLREGANKSYQAASYMSLKI